jgi:hypothetical protein
MPASAAQIFGPTTVDPDFTTTGEKTLLTMSTTLPSGGKNIILAAILPNASLSTTARGDIRIYKGSTLLYGTYLTTIYFNYSYTRGMPPLIMAVDTSPDGNDTYYLKINITSAGSSTGSIHVQGMVIKTDDAVWGYNTSAVSIDNGATGTVLSISTTFPANSKVVIVAAVYGYPSTSSHSRIGAGNIRIKSGTTTLSSNQFSIGGYSSLYPLWASLEYLDSPSSSSQTYSVEVYNDSGASFNLYAMLVAFTVSDGAFLDTGSVSLNPPAPGPVQTTVGNLSTTLSGDVAVIGLGATENTGLSDVTAFNANDVVLQKDNSSTGQISNLVGWYLYRNSYAGRSGVLPMFRLDTDVTNPSYQIKMTARTSNINGEAKILAFSLMMVVTVSVSDSGSGVDAVDVSASLSLGDSGAGVDVVSMAGSVPVVDSGSGVDTVSMTSSIPVGDSGVGAEHVNMVKESRDSGAGVDVVSMAGNIPVTDSGSGAEYVDMVKEALDSGVGVDYFTGGVHKAVDDSGSGVEVVDMTGSVLASDAGYGVDAVSVGASVNVGDSGAGVEVASVGVLQSDGGVGADYPGVVFSIPVSDGGYGVEVASLTANIPAVDFGSGLDAVNMSKECIDSGAGVELINMAKEVMDYGMGMDSIPFMLKESGDAGFGVDAVNMSKEVKDLGTGADIIVPPRLNAVADSGSGVDAVGIVGYVSVEDSGAGVDVAETFLSMYGYILIDDSDDVGIHSIPYRDMCRDGLPIQSHRRKVDDLVYVDGEENIGDASVEWVDKVSDISPGTRTVIVLGIVEVVD